MPVIISNLHCFSLICFSICNVKRSLTEGEGLIEDLSIESGKVKILESVDLVLIRRISVLLLFILMKLWENQVLKILKRLGRREEGAAFV